ncbi:MAG: hypothetical protein FWG71_05235 [Synergistaceae bacterium]|nr:hypothetical protein [Synergistaceae bacterium]
MQYIEHPAETGAFLLGWDGVLSDIRLNFVPLRDKYFGGGIVPFFKTAATLPEPDRSAVLAEISKIEIEEAAMATAMEGAKDLIAWLVEELRLP